MLRRSPLPVHDAKWAPTTAAALHLRALCHLALPPSTGLTSKLQLPFRAPELSPRLAAEQMPLAPAHDTAFCDLRKKEKAGKQATKDRRLFQSSDDDVTCAVVHSCARKPHLGVSEGRTAFMRVLASHDHHGP